MSCTPHRLQRGYACIIVYRAVKEGKSDGTGDGAWLIDYLSSLEAWVKRGQAPDSRIGAHVQDSTRVGALLRDPAVPVAFTRPVFPYPVYARYKGKGDPRNAEYFKPIAP